MNIISIILYILSCFAFIAIETSANTVRANINDGNFKYSFTAELQFKCLENIY